MNKRIIAMLSALLLVGIVLVRSEHAHAQALPKKIPVTVTADKLDYDRTTDVYIAVGHVKIEQEAVRLEADKVVLNNKTGVAEAEGNVYLQDKGDVVRAEKLKMNLNTQEGVITRGYIFMKKDNYHLKGDTIERTSETTYHVETGEFSTCDEKQWVIKADELNIDMARYATGRGVSFTVEGVPVAYTPYLLFPVRRQTGFLVPMAGYSSNDGMFADNAFFWAISDSKDATLFSDYRARIGHGTGLEYRYMNSQESMGQAYGKVWDMYHGGPSRWEFQFQHQEEFAEDLSARADIRLVSDDRYYYDLDKKLDVRSIPYIDSNAFYVERWNTASLYLLGQYSTDLTQPNTNTVQKLPELRYTIFEETIAGPLRLNFEGAATDFIIQEQNGVRRMDFNPQVTAAFGSGGLSLTPRAGVRATFYDRSATTTEATERKYVYAGVDLNARISKVYGSDDQDGIGRIRHSIEPTVSYSYIPRVDQSAIPQFDSLDTVSSQNQASVALINRLTVHYREPKATVTEPAVELKDSPTGTVNESKTTPAGATTTKDTSFTTYDMMVFRLSQSYDLNVMRDETSTAHTQSDVLGELFIKTPRLLTITASSTYNTFDHALSSHTVGASLGAAVVTMSLSETYTRGNPPTQYLIGSTGLTLGRWNLSGSGSRDMENRKTTQEGYALHYAAQCWGISITYSAAPGDYRTSAMVDLKGFGSRGYGKR